MSFQIGVSNIADTKKILSSLNNNVFFLRVLLTLLVLNSGVNAMSIIGDTSAHKFSVHEFHNLHFGKKKSDTLSVKANLGGYMPTKKFVLDYEVLGWLPYWEDKNVTNNLNFSLLSTLAYFSYELDDRTGKPKSLHEWETTSIIDSALSNKKKVLLTVTNFGEFKNKHFLKNHEAINTFIATVKNLLEKRKAHGVCLDFEGVSKLQRDDFTEFIQLLNKEFKKGTSSYLIYLAVPYIDWQEFLDLKNLSPLVDQFVIMGYSYHNRECGPISPMSSFEIWGNNNLNKSVSYYLNAIPSNKVMLGLPFYGNVWDTDGHTMGAKSIKSVGPRTFSYIKKHIAGILGRVKHDTISKSALVSYPMNHDGTLYRHCWYESDSSLSVKLDYVKTKKMNGIGIWALGFDAGYDDYWKVIAKKLCGSLLASGSSRSKLSSQSLNTSKSSSTGFIANVKSETSKVVEGISAEKKTIEENFLKYTDMIVLSFVMVVFFGGVGFVIAMLQPNTSLVLFNDTARLIYYILFVLVFLIAALRLLNIINDTSIALIIGFLLGAIAMYGVNELIKAIYKNVP